MVGIIGFGHAAELAAAEQPAHARSLAELRSQLRAALSSAVPDLVVIGEDATTAPRILTVCIPGAESEALLMHLDLAGIAAGSGSACTTGAVDPSHVLAAMGVPREHAVGAVRLSLGRDTNRHDIARVAEAFPAAVAKARRSAGALAR